MGAKTFELRKFDRDYQVGDRIHFIVVDKDGKQVAESRSHDYQITYILSDCEKYGLMQGYCILGIKKV